MLPSLGFNEIIILGILALVVVGPKDLPLLFRKLGRWTAKLRGMAQEFRTGFDELARQAELDELKREVDALRKTTSLHEIRSELSKPLPTLEDYAGVKSPTASPPRAAPAEAPALTPPTAPARGPSGAMVQTERSEQHIVAAEDVPSDDAPEEAQVSNVTPMMRSAP